MNTKPIPSLDDFASIHLNEEGFIHTRTWTYFVYKGLKNTQGCAAQPKFLMLYSWACQTLQNPRVCSPFQHRPSKMMTSPKDLDTVSPGPQRQHRNSKRWRPTVLWVELDILASTYRGLEHARETVPASVTLLPISFVCIMSLLSLKGKE